LTRHNLLRNLLNTKYGFLMAQRGRGRPAKDEASRKSEPVSIRLTPDLRTRLESERLSADPQRTLSQEIELRIRESFDLDKSIKQLLGGADHYWLIRILAQQIVVIEHQTARHFWEDRFTFDLVKASTNTILDHFEPAGASSLPERLSLLDASAIKGLGKQLALLALASLELGATCSGDVLVLSDFVDSIAAGRQLFPRMTKSALAELDKDWRQAQSATKTATTKSRRKPK
jgi:hypothetical protein